MSEYVLENGELRASFRSQGGELTSLVKKENGQEYIWKGDSAYWGWHSPVLFPLVGSLKGGSYTHQGKSYTMGQHGLARRMEFDLLKQEEDAIWFVLKDTAATWETYPFAFRLEIGYQLSGKELKVLWRVKNPGQETLYFSIGAHPAFLCPAGGEKPHWQGAYIGFDTRKDHIVYKLVDLSCGLAAPDTYLQPLEDGMFPVQRDTFDRDALILEDKQVSEVFLAGEDKVPYLSVKFDTPLVGLWSPVKKDAPFICIEPWYGRCDGVEFEGEWKDRKYGNSLAPGETFAAEYTISVK